MTLSYTKCAWESINDSEINDFVLFIILLFYLFSIVMSTILIGFMAFHLMFIGFSKYQFR